MQTVVFRPTIATACIQNAIPDPRGGGQRAGRTEVAGRSVRVRTPQPPRSRSSSPAPAARGTTHRRTPSVYAKPRKATAEHHGKPHTSARGPGSPVAAPGTPRPIIGKFCLRPGVGPAASRVGTVQRFIQPVADVTHPWRNPSTVPGWLSPLIHSSRRTTTRQTRSNTESYADRVIFTLQCKISHIGWSVTSWDSARDRPGGRWDGCCRG